MKTLAELAEGGCPQYDGSCPCPPGPLLPAVGDDMISDSHLKYRHLPSLQVRKVLPLVTQTPSLRCPAEKQRPLTPIRATLTYSAVLRKAHLLGPDFETLRVPASFPQRQSIKGFLPSEIGEAFAPTVGTPDASI